MKCRHLGYAKPATDNGMIKGGKKWAVCDIEDRTIMSRIEDVAKYYRFQKWAPNHCPFSDNGKHLKNPCLICPINYKEDK